MIKFIEDYYQKEADKKKTENGKAASYTKRDEVLEYFKKNSKQQIILLFDLYNMIVDAKLMIIQKLDKAKTIGTFLKTRDGYEVTEQEGFVAIDHIGKNAVKLVDRLGFSKANFSTEYIKGFEKRN
jgi:hypothetical protein